MLARKSHQGLKLLRDRESALLLLANLLLCRLSEAAASDVLNLPLSNSMKSIASFILLACLFLNSGCQTAAPTPSGKPEAPVVDETLVAGNVLRVSFTGAPAMDQAQRIRPDGKITLPMIGEVRVAGKRALAVQEQLMQAYKTKLQNNEITVWVESSVITIYVSGAVNKPGKISLDRPLTALEAIMEAGGFARGLADAKRVKIIRQVDGKHQTLVVDLTPALRGEATKTINVQRYDVIYVPETWL